MLVRSLIRRFVLMNAMPDDGAAAGGGGAAPAPAPVVDAPAAAAAPEPAAAASAPAAAPADAFDFLRTQLEAVGSKPDADSGQPRDPSGRFATAAQKAAGVAATPAPAPAAAATPPAPTPAPKSGEVDLTPPEGMNERSQQRWSQLTERAKQLPALEQRATELESQLGAVRQLVAESGLAPQEFTQWLTNARMLRSPANPQEAQQALQWLEQQRAAVAQRFGFAVPGVDPLAAHPDLKADVDGMLMTRERALEIAQHRQHNQHFQQQAAQSEQAQREQAQFRQTVQSAAQQMDATLQQRAGTPGHEAKVQYIRQHFADPKNLQAFVATYEPRQWAAVVTTMYDLYQPPRPVAATPAAPPTPQPLRPGAVRPGAQVQTTPLTAMDAVQGAFANLGIGA